jgi:hypothetical protein
MRPDESTLSARYVIFDREIVVAAITGVPQGSCQAVEFGDHERFAGATRGEGDSQLGRPCFGVVPSAHACGRSDRF